MSQHCAGGSMRLCPPPDHVGCPQDWRGQSTPQGSGCAHTSAGRKESRTQTHIFTTAGGLHHCHFRVPNNMM